MIDHEGIIEQIRGDLAHVKISSESACAACHAKGACMAADQEEKYLDIELTGTEFAVGEKVKVLVARNLGLRAVALGYIYPFLLLMTVLVILSVTGVNEMKAGLFALLSLLPYYLGLYLTRQRMGKTFTFSIEKTSTV
jgi:sigma-E factor negative regulatory protein RseC